VLNIDVNELNDQDTFNTIGWEKNEKNQYQPRIVDMSSSMNSEKLAESAVSLNLKLMKWRIAPDVDLNVIKAQKCLLLGSGTLGCNVARCLLGWGVETITLVDNSKISYSNPVRQSLFTFNDSTMSMNKAVRAAESLKLIYPGVVCIFVVVVVVFF
jgi:ubiquitin-like modifier-activating enzyme ATG7